MCKLHEGSVTALWCGYQAIKTEVFVNLPSYFLAPLRLAAAVDVFGGKNVRMTPWAMIRKCCRVSAVWRMRWAGVSCGDMSRTCDVWHRYSWDINTIVDTPGAKHRPLSPHCCHHFLWTPWRKCHLGHWKWYCIVGQTFKPGNHL